MKTLPRKIGRYLATQIIGEGGAGTVYLGVDERLNRPVAIKVAISRSMAEEERFTNEAQTAARLIHPNIASIYDVGVVNGEHFVVQEYLAGFDLAKMIASHTTGVPQSIAAGVLLQIAKALAYAHENGVVHRDIKPSNVIIIESGIAKLLDFGLATILEEPNNLTITGTMLGTPAYMSPEAIQGKPVTTSSDVFSFGVLAFELLTGRKPFIGKSFLELAQAIVSGPRPTIPSAGGFPEEFARIIESCIAIEPISRPESMKSIVTSLSQFESFWSPLALPMNLIHPNAISKASGEEKTVKELDGKAFNGDNLSPTSNNRKPESSGGIPDDWDPWGEMATSKANSSKGGDSLSINDPFAELGFGVDSATLKSRDAEKPRGNPSNDPFSVFGGDKTVIKPNKPMEQKHISNHAGSKTIGRFVLHEKIADGHSGDMYIAFDPVRGELVAIKLVRADSPEVSQRLLRGGRIWINLRHPNIIKVLEVHPEYEGLAGVIVYDLIRGINLEQLRSQRHLNLTQIVTIMLQVCNALEALHSIGVVHREVKPRNILVSGTDLQTVLLDSGIARHANPDFVAFSQTGVFVGDLAYASPEQASGRVDQRTDIYSVAAILYEAVTNSKLPFPVRADWALDQSLFKDVPDRILQILERGLQNDPKKRFSSIRELHDQLRGFAPPQKGSGAIQAVIALHGIRTQAAWQRAFSEAAANSGLLAHVDRWNFGYFSVFRLLSPWSRLAKVRWFRKVYQQEFSEAVGNDQIQPPSIVAHSFGTLILGNAIVRYPYLRFDKILLCGSILPTNFPWDKIIERGQVQSVRNEYGKSDFWTRIVGWFIPATGPSGLHGFSTVHARIMQEQFDFDHGEYFERGHMENRWIPFLSAKIERSSYQMMEVSAVAGDHPPWALVVTVLVIIIGFSVGLIWTIGRI